MAKARRPGRPPSVAGGLGFIARIRMRVELWRRVEAAAGAGGASEFARDAIERAVERAERKRD
jgi:hypothetical protein